MRNILLIVFGIVFLIVGYVLYSDFSTLTVSELNESATKYDGETVTTTGIVVKNASLLGAGGFIITDGSSNLLVLSSGGVPEHESQIEVTGKFKKAVTLNSFEYNVIYTDGNG